jgi:N utilization substance protein B
MKRRKAREYVLQFLYGIDFTKLAGNISPEELKEKLNLFWKEAGEKDRDVKKFASDIIKGTLIHLGSIDAAIQSAAENWRLERMASVDRNILRYAAYELMYQKDIPPAVAINEAIEIAKTYSTLESASFINGILDKILKDLSSTCKETLG